MSLKMALAGGGGAKDSQHIDKYFAHWNGQNGKILYIPIALRDSNHSFDGCYDWVQSTLVHFGISQIEMWTDLTKHQAKELDAFDSIYIGGGNAFSLLAELIDSGFDQAFRHYALEGMPIYGGSAGAVVLGKDIMTIEHIDSNNVGLEQRACLDLALGYSIWVHYQASDDILIRKYIKATQYEVLAISERSGVIIEGNRVQSIGFEVAYRFEGDQKQEIE